MATVKEFKEWLNRFPDETIVFVAFQERSTGWESYGPVTLKTLELKDSDWGDGWDYTDWTKNQFVKEGDKHFGEKHLDLGEKD